MTTPSPLDRMRAINTAIAALIAARTEGDPADVEQARQRLRDLAGAP